LSEKKNLVESGPLASVRDLLVNTQKKNLRNDSESGCGWLYSTKTLNQRKILRKTQKDDTVLKNYEKDTQTEI